MKRFHANIGSRHAALEQRPKVLKRIGVYSAIYVLRSMVNNLVRVIGRQSLIGKQCVCVQSRASFNMLANLSLQGTLATIRNDRSTNLSATLHDSNNCGLIFSASASNATLPLAQVHIPRLAANEGLVNFNLAAVGSQLGSEKLIL